MTFPKLQKMDHELCLHQKEIVCCIFTNQIFMNFVVILQNARGGNGLVDLLPISNGKVGSMQCTFLKILSNVKVSIIIFFTNKILD